MVVPVQTGPHYPKHRARPFCARTPSEVGGQRLRLGAGSLSIRSNTFKKPLNEHLNEWPTGLVIVIVGASGMHGVGGRMAAQGEA